ncbi:hypothetical protein [Sphingomonas sp. LT1P40]|uniref:hypothetical protein n=1 Tax=Alteristakelama amylovorans TaxID=3096166 RepID=UPI002FC99B3B
MPATLIALIGALVLMASMPIVALGIVGSMLALSGHGWPYLGRSPARSLAASLLLILLGFAIYFGAACAIGWAMFR